MDRTDKILVFSLLGILAALVLIAYAPIALPANSLSARLWSLADSGFMIALVGSFAGAFAGAIGAQTIAERSAERKSLAAEIAATNFAIAASHSVVNAYLSFKKQIVVDVCSHYWAHRRNFSTAVKTGRAIAIPNENFALDFRIFEPPYSSIELLQRELQERVRSSGASLAFFALLREAMDTLEKVIAARSDLIARFREAPLSEQYALYFAVHPDDGVVDGTYPFQMKMVEDLTNDCVGTAIILGELLEEHGRKLAKKFGNGAPKIVRVVAWSEDDPKLVPDMGRYRGWLEKAFAGLH